MVLNPSFESDVLGPGGIDVTPTDWDTSPGGGDGVFSPLSFQYPNGAVPDGVNVAYANESGNRVRQMLAEVLEPHTTYTLTVDIGRRLDESYVGYIIQLRANGDVLAEDNSSQSPAPGQFVTASASFTTDSSPAQLGEPLDIWLLSLGTQVNFDNVRLEKTSTVVNVADVPALHPLAMLSLVSLLLLVALRHLRR